MAKKKSKREKNKEIMFENELIKLVRPNLDIYDKTSPKHKDQRHIGFLWQTISATLTAVTSMPSTELQCMTLWLKIKNRYSKERSVTRNVSSGPEGVASTSRWVHFNSLKWLDQFTKKKSIKSEELSSSFSPMITDIDKEENETTAYLNSETGVTIKSQGVTRLNNSVNSNNTGPPNKKIKLESNYIDLTKVLVPTANTLNKLLETDNNDLRSFCDYLYTEMKKINDEEKLKECKKSFINTVFSLQ